MQARDGQLVFSPSDLSDFLACAHLSTLELQAARGERARPEGQRDPQAELVARKGEEHERRYLERLRAAGKRIASAGLERDSAGYRDYERAMHEALAHVRDGVDVVYQAAFAAEGWRGLADFLERQPDGSYEVVDTKLARHAKPAHLFQLCFYGELLGRLTGRPPRRMHLELGDGRRESFAVADFDAYYRRVRARFLAAARDGRATQPYPVAHCALCPWREQCEAEWDGADHLLRVARIRRKQIERLTAAGISTLAQLAAAAPGTQVPHLEPGTFEGLRRQAELQHWARVNGRLHEPVPLPAGKRRGLALLPEPDEGDVFYDIEGDPFYDGDGPLEYLHGVVTRDGAFHAFRGVDRAGERRAFEQLVDWLTERRRRHPRLHVYHYANYERAALQRLMQAHLTREQEVDELLRGEVLVDLYQVVRQGLRLSLPSYSLKQVEAYYFPARETDVLGGDESTVVFEQFLESGVEALLRAVEAYNRDDCLSTLELHRWLLALRPAGRPWRAPPEPRETTDEAEAQRTERDALRARLLADAREGDARWLAAHLLDYHRRDAKPEWWDYFRRLTLDGEQLLADSCAIGGIELDPTVEPRPEDRSLVFTLRFPPQEWKLGDDAVDPATEASPGSILALDGDEGRILLKRGRRKQQEPLPRALVPGKPLPTRAQQEAVLRVATAFADGRDEHRAAQDVLARARPRARLDGTLVDAVASLERSYFVVQGPPGSGKTYLGARAAVALLAAGVRVGVTSTSHKAIHNFLAEVVARAGREGVRFRGLKKCGDRDGTRFEGSALVANSGDNADFEEGCEHQLVAGTPWLFSRAGVRVDVLFVDEAGQMALADALAVAASAESLVLLGDPNQLPQVSQGAQPAAVRASVLEHLLAGETTVPPDRGVFLAHTWRLHPEVCRFVSETFYDGRLGCAPPCERRDLEGGCGLRFLPVEHTGRRSAAPEEADAIEAELASLLGRAFTDADGATRPLRLEDVLIVAPYNAQVRLLHERLPGARVGTVDRFQGQQAPVVFFSMASSSGEELPRGIEFLFSRNRLNVAVSRAQCRAYVVASPRLLEADCRSPGQMRLVNALCRFVELAERSPAVQAAETGPKPRIG